MAHRLQLLDATGALAFDFTDRAGTNNPHGLKAWPMSDLAFGFSSGDPVFHEPRSRPGGLLVERQERLVESRFHLKVDADDADALHFGVSELDYLLKQGGVLEWQPDGGTTRFIDFETGWTEGLLRGQDVSMLYIRSGDWEGLPIVIMRQPGLRLAGITSAAEAVPNDPAAVGGMIFEGEIEGDLPAPVGIKLTSQGGSIRRAIVALFQGDGYADYVATRKFFQAESGTLSNDTASVADADASGGNAAQCTHATNPTVFAKRVRIPISTLLDPYKRELAIFCRMKATAAAVHEVQLRWAPSLADPATFSEDTVTLDSDAATSHGYVFKRLGTIRIPDGIPIAGAVIELWTRRVSGTGNLRFDFVAFLPADAIVTELALPGGGVDEWLPADLVTPTNPAGLLAGSTQAHTGQLRLDAQNEAGGTPPNSGTSYAEGRHTAVFEFNPNGDLAMWTIRVRNITDSTTVVSASGGGQTGTQRHDLPFDAVAGKAYQFQLVKTDTSTHPIWVDRMLHVANVVGIGVNESFLTAPENSRAYRLDSAGAFGQELESAGGIPAWIEPGPFALVIHALDVERLGYTEGESVLTRAPLASISYSPRVPM